MAYRLVEVVCETANAALVRELLAKQHNLADWWETGESGGRSGFKLLADSGRLQQTLDALSTAFHHLPNAHLIVQEIEALHPEPRDTRQEERLSFFGGLTRQELYDEVAAGANLNLNFLVMLALSTIVAAIGLHTGDLAVVIGAMVIAPMLQPHIAFALGASLGDFSLMRRAAVVNLTGLGIVLTLAAAIGFFWPNGGEWNDVIMDRARIDYSNIALALAAGAAAVLSLTTGVSSALVGVMVAVALLPPLAAAGLFLGTGYYGQAADAGWLAAINIVCINIASKLVFQLKNVRAHSPESKRASRQALLISYVIWAVLLAAAIYIIATQKPEA